MMAAVVIIKQMKRPRAYATDTTCCFTFDNTISMTVKEHNTNSEKQSIAYFNFNTMFLVEIDLHTLIHKHSVNVSPDLFLCCCKHMPLII